MGNKQGKDGSDGGAPPAVAGATPPATPGTRGRIAREMRQEQRRLSNDFDEEAELDRELAFLESDTINTPQRDGRRVSEGIVLRPPSAEAVARAGRRSAAAGGGGSAAAPAPDAESPRERRPSYWQMAKTGYNELVNAIIRPPRAEYDPRSDLGPPKFTLGGGVGGTHAGGGGGGGAGGGAQAPDRTVYERTDFQLRNARGLRLECSHWRPCAAHRRRARMPCVIYLHGNSSCRAESLECLPLILSSGATLFALDCAGSGLSEGAFISLGHYERDDVQAVIAHLRASGGVSTVGIWGRSMGAVTALLHGDRDPSIACLVLDSPFSSLRGLARELVDSTDIRVPKVAVSLALRFVRRSVRKMAKFDINKLEPLAHADKCFIPALFVHGKHDRFIQPSHTEAIHAKYAGDKNLVLFDGDHNAPRPRFFFDSAGIFLQQTLCRPGLEAARHFPENGRWGPLRSTGN